MGVQNDDMIMPVRREGHAVPITAYGNATNERILNQLAGDEGVGNYFLHFICGGAVAIGMLVLRDCYVPFRVCILCLCHF